MLTKIMINVLDALNSVTRKNVLNADNVKTAIDNISKLLETEKVTLADITALTSDSDIYDSTQLETLKKILSVDHLKDSGAGVSRDMFIGALLSVIEQTSDTYSEQHTILKDSLDKLINRDKVDEKSLSVTLEKITAIKNTPVLLDRFTHVLNISINKMLLDTPVDAVDYITPLDVVTNLTTIVPDVKKGMSIINDADAVSTMKILELAKQRLDIPKNEVDNTSYINSVLNLVDRQIADTHSMLSKFFSNTKGNKTGLYISIEEQVPMTVVINPIVYNSVNDFAIDNSVAIEYINIILNLPELIELYNGSIEVATKKVDNLTIGTVLVDKLINDITSTLKNEFDSLSAQDISNLKLNILLLSKLIHARSLQAHYTTLQIAITSILKDIINVNAGVLSDVVSKTYVGD